MHPLSYDQPSHHGRQTGKYGDCAKPAGWGDLALAKYKRNDTVEQSSGRGTLDGRRVPYPFLQHVIQNRRELPRIHGFLDIPRRAQITRPRPRVGIIAPTDDNNALFQAQWLQETQNLFSGHAGHHEIQKDQVEPSLNSLIQAVPGVRGRVDGSTCPLQADLDDFQIERVVVDRQNPPTKRTLNTAHSRQVAHARFPL